MTAILFLQSPISYARAARSLNLQSGADAMAYEWLRLGVRAAVEGNREDARYYFVQAVRTDLNLGRAWLYLGGVADDAALTLSCMQKVLQLEPNEPQAWNGLIWAREKLGLLQLPLPLVPPMTGTTPTRSLGAPATAVLPTDEGTAGPPASGHRTSVLGPDDAGRPHRPVTQPLTSSRLGRTPITSTLSPSDLTAGPSTAELHTSTLADAAATPEIVYRPDTMMRTGTLEQAGRLARRQTGPLEEPPPAIGTYYPASSSTTSTLAEPTARPASPQTMPLFPATVDEPPGPAEPIAAAPQSAEAEPVAALQTAPLETEDEPGVLASLAALFAPLPVIEAPPEEPNEIAFAPASGVEAAAAPEVTPAEAPPPVAEALAPAGDTLLARPAEITFASVVEAAPEPPAAPIAAAPVVEVEAPVAVTVTPAAPVAPPAPPFAFPAAAPEPVAESEEELSWPVPAEPGGSNEILALVSARLLRHGMDAAALGNRGRARYFFLKAIAADGNNVQAWLYYGGIAQDAATTLACMERVLRSEPGNQEALTGAQWARWQLGILGNQTA